MFRYSYKRLLYYYLNWDYYDKWDEQQKRRKYLLNKQIEESDLKKLLERNKNKKIRKKRKRSNKS